MYSPKRPVILRSLLIVATPYVVNESHHRLMCAMIRSHVPWFTCILYVYPVQLAFQVFAIVGGICCQCHIIHVNASCHTRAALRLQLRTLQSQLDQVYIYIYAHESWHVWLNHGTHESWHTWMSHDTYPWVMSQARGEELPSACYIWLSHSSYQWVTVNTWMSKDKYEWVISEEFPTACYIWLSHSSYQWVTVNTWMGNDKYEWVISQARGEEFPTACHIWMSHGTFEQVTAHMNHSRHL